MERVLILRLQAHRCAAEVQLNDIPVGSVGARGGLLCLPVHEYLLAGANSIKLVIDPPPAGVVKFPATPKIADGAVGASVRLLLPRIGQFANELHARMLADIDWAMPDGDVYQAPQVVSGTVSLPIKFPRWRWLDAPEIHEPESLKPQVAAFLQGIVIAMGRGDFDVFLTASRLRLEELALAYQRPMADISSRLRSRLQLLHATRALKMVMPNVAELNLRPCAKGRLLECVGPEGEPALRTLPAPDGSRTTWPVRIAVVNGQCHILR